MIWGSLHGLALMVNHLWNDLRGPSPSKSAWAVIVGRTSTFLWVLLAWVFFRADSTATAFRMLGSMLNLKTAGVGDLLGDASVRHSLPWMAILLTIALFFPEQSAVGGGNGGKTCGSRVFAPGGLCGGWHGNSIGSGVGLFVS